jgi:glycosyltransferase involved in cell wall biosynthesis
MEQILYLGNKFYKYKKVKSSLETLEPLLAEFCNIKTASSKKNQLLRFIDMLYHFFRYGLTSDKIIIDVYSTLAFNFAFVLSIFSWIFNKKYILFLRGGNLTSRYVKSKKMVTMIFIKAYKIIAPSIYLKNYFEEMGFNVEHIPNIIELGKYPFKLRENLRPNIMAIRGFGKPYNPLMTLKAVNEIKHVIPKLKLLMLGNQDDFYYNDVINYIATNQLQDVVTIKPKCSRDEWVAISKDYDIMVSNPIIDNTPVSLIEGMALGMCIISTNVGGVRFLANDGQDSMLIKDNDSVGLVNVILELLNNNEKARSLSLNARRHAEDYDWNKIKRDWYLILNSN